jgi:hypothetical protein
VIDYDALTRESLRGPHVRLEPVSEADADFLYELGCDHEHRFRWRLRGASVSRQSVLEALQQSVFVQFVVWGRRTGSRIGHAVAYNADVRSGTVNLGLAMRAPFIRSGLGAEANLVLARYVMDLWPFRKVYGELPEFNAPYYDLRSGLIVEVGRLRDHIYYDGRYWDQIVVTFMQRASE